MLLAIILGIIGFFLLILLGIRSVQIHRLKKHNLELKQQMNLFKSNQEEFAMRLQKMTVANGQDVLRDPLTNLIGERGFDDRYSQLLHQSERFNHSFAILILNIDNFRTINQNSSHETGDKILIELAKRLKQTIRQVDTMSRFAGDVFLFLLPNLTTPETVVYAAQRLLDATQMPLLIDNKDFQVTSCIGIAVYPYDGKDKETLLAHAKSALQKAKKSGKNLFQFYQEETQALGERELNLKSSIMSEDFLTNLGLDFQPYFNTLTNEVVCLQTIAYLNHPELGRVPFSDFARIAQNSEKMPELYEWMMRNAILHYKNLANNAEKPKQLLMTFTLKQMEKSMVIDKIIAITKEANISPEEIILDVTDDIDGADFELLKKSFTILKENQFHIAIGILVLGHFALKKIINLPINYLKVDDKLIKDITIYSESHNILERILSLANNLNIGVITEGVDQEEQKKILESLGCYVMQGKFFINYTKRSIKA
jgi:diguanylate cyclase (GGDEF)-like protein